jgi:hypothetical protein
MGSVSKQPTFMANYFPRWTNLIPLKIAICIGAVGIGVVTAFTYYATPKAQRVGYMPDQPIPFDHALHVTQLGLDCRHCHSFVEKSGHANVPTANTCANCHVKGQIQTDSPRLAPLYDALETGEPIKWVRIHRAPDYVYFNHSAHLGRGISCVECHGQVDEMTVVYHAKSLSMGSCLECHRNPEDSLRPLEQVFNLKYQAVDYLKQNQSAADQVSAYIKDKDLGLEIAKKDDAQQAMGLMLKDHWKVQPKESCFTCHR